MNPEAMNILFVDDDEVMAQSVELALRANGHACEIAGTGEGAVALCKSRAYDIAVLDVGLPDMDALHLVRRLKIEGVETPVLLQSGRHEPELSANAARLGIEDFLTKPFSIATLLERMEQVLARGGRDGNDAPADPADPAAGAGAASGEVPGTDGAERRRHERKPVVEAAMIVDGGSIIPCIIINLSESGAGLRFADPEQHCSETFELQPLYGEVRHCSRRWREGAFMGVEFS